MSLAALEATGLGKLEFRVVIEGLPHTFVSHKSMAGTDSLGRTKIDCLSREGLVIEDSCIPYQALIEAAGMQVVLVDRQSDDAVTAALFTLPTQYRYLTADLTTAGTTLTVNDTAGWVANQVVHIGTEAIKLGTIASSTSVTGCTRAQYQTIAQAHYTESSDLRLSLAAITDKPYSLEGRRAYLYLYGEGDDLTGDGTLRWRGICATDAGLKDDGCSWQITVDPIWRLLEQDLGGTLEQPKQPRGIYYHAYAPLMIELGESNTANDDGSFLTGTGQTILIYGFFANNQALCDEINARIATYEAGFSETWDELRAIADGDEDWFFQITVDASAPRFPYVYALSAVDGSQGQSRRPAGGGWGISQRRGGSPVDTVLAGGVYVTVASPSSLPGVRAVPRGYFGRWSWRGRFTPSATDLSSYPTTRVYLGGTGSLTGVTSVDYEFSRTDMGEPTGTVSVTRDSTDRWINMGIDTIVAGPYTREMPLTITVSVSYAEGDLADFITALTTLAPTEANRGGTPFITTSDIDASASVIASAHGGHAWLSRRRYTTAKAVEVAEVVAHAARALGVIPSINTSGVINFREWAQPVATDSVAAAIDSSVIVIDSGYPTWQRNAEGSINSVLVGIGYDAHEDEYRSTYEIRDATAYALRKSPRELEVMQKSTEMPPSQLPSFMDVTDAVAPILGLFGRDYAIVECEVPMSVSHLTIGDYVTLTSPHLPDGTGGRGMVDQPGMVIGRQWMLDEGRGRLTILVSYLKAAGYTPSVRITSVSGSGSSWTLTVTSMDPYSVHDLFRAGDSLSDHFADGYRVKVSQWDTASPTSEFATAGTVTDTGTNPATGTIAVTFDSAYTPAAGMMVGFDNTPADAVADQQLYMFLAGADARITFGSDVDARQWAP